MPLHDISDIERLKKINAALISRVERSMDQQGNAFTLFQTAINLENRVRSRTEELRSTLRRLEESNISLYAAKEAAELANRSKTRFLAAASHDVLQPLNAAHLSISALAETQASEEGRRLVGQVERSLTTIGNLLQTLLDISRLDAGVVEPDIADIALEQLFASIKSDFQPLAEQKGLKFRFRAGNAIVRSDRTMLRRILQNIVSNAMRYTQSGGVLVGARRRGAIVRIEIADTGCGIPSDQHEAVFEEFHRGVSVSKGDISGAGLGLGLSIVRRMAGTLGHPIGFSSVVGRGTVFRLDVPAASPNSLPAAAGASVPGHPRGYGLFGTKVLLIEDDAEVSATMAATARALAMRGARRHFVDRGAACDRRYRLGARRRHSRPASGGRRSRQPYHRRREILSGPCRAGADHHRRQLASAGAGGARGRHRIDAQAGQAGRT